MRAHVYKEISTIFVDLSKMQRGDNASNRMQKRGQNLINCTLIYE